MTDISTRFINAVSPPAVGLELTVDAYPGLRKLYHALGHVKHIVFGPQNGGFVDGGS